MLNGFQSSLSVPCNSMEENGVFLEIRSKFGHIGEFSPTVLQCIQKRSEAIQSAENFVLEGPIHRGMCCSAPSFSGVTNMGCCVLRDHVGTNLCSYTPSGCHHT